MRSLHHLETVAEVLSSRMVEVIAGPEKKLFRLHVAALTSSESPSLKVMVSEQWDPGNNKVVDWSHTESDTVLRFITYLYTGDYHIPDPELLPVKTSDSASTDTSASSKDAEASAEPVNGNETGQQSESVPPQEVTDVNNEIQTGQAPEPEPSQAEPDNNADTANEPDNDPNLQKAIFESFENRPLTPFDKCVDLEIAEAVTSTDSTFDGTAFPYTTHSYRRPVLALAQLYCFAVYHSCPLLQKSTLHRLVNVLQPIDCSQPHAKPEMADLVHFVYENTLFDRTNPDPMRKVISTFIAINYTQLMGEEFAEVFALGGDFVVDVMSRVCRRLLANAESNRSLLEDQKSLKAKIKSQKERIGSQKEDLEAKQQEIERLEKIKVDPPADPPGVCRSCRKKKSPSQSGLARPIDFT